LPLIVETLLITAAAYLIGVGVGWRIFRPRRETFL
jgi:hypothetical protein